MKRITLKFTGTSPVLLVSDKLADPLNPATIKHKELTSKRKKTEDDHLLIARSQWEGLLYHDDEMGIYMPSQNIRAALVGGAKLNKMGQAFKRSTLILDEKIELDYGKKKTVDQLWSERFMDVRSVKIGTARVMAYRPMFKNWAITFNFDYDESTLDINQIIQAAENAGMYVGIGGYRPEKGGMFGRFKVEVVK